MSRAAAVSWCCWFAFVSMASARDIFVDNIHGDDRREGTTQTVTGRTGGPCRSIRRALQLAQPGDRIILAKNDEPYRESVSIQAGKHTGTAKEPFEILGNGAILDGSQPIPKGGWEHVRGDVYRFHPARTSYQIVYLGDKPATRRAVNRDDGLPTLEPLEWCLYERHIYFRTEGGKLPTDYPLAYAHHTVGITVYEVRHVRIRDLIVQGFQLDGINSHDSVFDGELQGVTCRGNGRSGVSVGGASRLRLSDCLLGDNGAAQLRTEGQSRTELVRCELLENSAPAVVRDGGLVLVEEKAP